MAEKPFDHIPASPIKKPLLFTLETSRKKQKNKKPASNFLKLSISE
jgi:hypothetical protein